SHAPNMHGGASRIGPFALSESSFDFGVIDSKTAASLSHRFTITNTGKSPMNLWNVRSSCGCTSAALSSTYLAHGESTSLDVRINWGPRLRRQEEAVWLDTDGGQSLGFSVCGFVNAMFSLSTRDLDFGIVQNGVPSTPQTVYL